ncbi:hypothetical protein PG990_006698 [Apiospora arundinis]
MSTTMSAHRDTQRYNQAQSVGTIRGRFQRLITLDQSRRAGLLWDSASSPPDLLRPRAFDDSYHCYNDGSSNHYLTSSDSAAPHGGLDIAATAPPPPSPPPLSKPSIPEPEGFPSFFWTPEEDRQLLELREQSKLDWEEIAERLMGRRSASACCSRYNRTLFNKHIEKMASKCSNNNKNRNGGGQLSTVVEEEADEGVDEKKVYQATPMSLLPLEASPYSAHHHPQSPMDVSPMSSSLLYSHEHIQCYHRLSALNLGQEHGDQSSYQSRSPPLEPLEPRVADTCSEVLTKARFCLSLEL